MNRNRRGEMDIWGIGFVIIIGGLIALAFYNDSKPTVFPRLRGHVEQPFLGTPAFVVSVFHQHPGNLRKGTLQVEIAGTMVRDSSGRDAQKYSFELWEPNEDHAVILKFPLRNYDPAQEIPVSFSISGSGIKDAPYQDVWTSNGWKSNQK